MEGVKRQERNEEYTGLQCDYPRLQWFDGIYSSDCRRRLQRNFDWYQKVQEKFAKIQDYFVSLASFCGCETNKVFDMASVADANHNIVPDNVVSANQIKTILLPHKKQWIRIANSIAIVLIGIAGNGCTYQQRDSQPYKVADTTFVDVADSIEFNYVYDYVDLGLSVKWATCNLGASEPEEYGDYYAWGEIKPRRGNSWDYDWNMTPYYKSGNCVEDVKWHKYTDKDDKVVLDPSDDAATVALGSPWRMPTIDETRELLDKCTWKSTTLNGKNGCKVIGPNGNSIFLPAAGYRAGSNFYDAGTDGSYWSSSLDTGYPGYAYNSDFYSEDHGWGVNSRVIGHSVRPVHP